jgi:hypothetical protein
MVMIFSKNFGRLRKGQVNSPTLLLTVPQHFKENHSHGADGRFIVPLPKKSPIKALGESHSRAVRWYRSLKEVPAIQRRV